MQLGQNLAGKPVEDNFTLSLTRKLSVFFSSLILKSKATPLTFRFLIDTMRPGPIVICLAGISFAPLPASVVAQQNTAPAGITVAIDEARVTTIKGNTHPLARPEFDRGPAPSNLPLNRMLLVLERSWDQELALESLLEQQQDKSSPNYHAWLSPEQFGQRFGPADQDIQTITSWLGSHGMHVDRVANGRGIIEFSGTVEQLKAAFRTEIHKYDVHGEEHWANSSDPQIPTALRPVVAGIVSLHNFPRKPLHHVVGAFSRTRDSGHYEPVSPPSPASSLFTAGVNCGLAGGPCYGVGPYDFATIYNVLPLWNANPPIDGTGQTIAIVGQSDIYPQDVSDFHQIFGLPAPKLNIIYNGLNPGKLASQGDEQESDLDVEWSSAIAKGATIDFVVSASTNTTAGTDLSAEYIIDNNLAPVMSESYGNCELDLGTSGNQFFNQMWQQAAAEGITVFVSSGDSGSAVCDGQVSPVAIGGLSVSGISSTPYNVAVGGTDFDDLQNPSNYWNSTNDPVTQSPPRATSRSGHGMTPAPIASSFRLPATQTRRAPATTAAAISSQPIWFRSAPAAARAIARCRRISLFRHAQGGMRNHPGRLAQACPTTASAMFQMCRCLRQTA